VLFFDDFCQVDIIGAWLLSRYACFVTVILIFLLVIYA